MRPTPALEPFLPGREAFTPGTVYLAGAGPGDPGLVACRVVALLAAADVIVHDHLVPPQALLLARPDAELVYVGKEAGRHTMPQEEINDLLVERALRGQVVARLKGGDPFVFGRGGEEALRCRERGVPFEVIPGVTSAIAAGAYAGIPVTHRNTALSFCLVTGHEALKPESQLDFKTLAGVDTLAVYMGVGQMEEITRRLRENGKDAATPAAVVMNGTMPGQRTVTGTVGTIVARAKEAGIAPPAILFVGPTVALRGELAWLERRPLAGKSVLVTRSREQAGTLSLKLAALGARAREVPTIRIVPPADPAPLDAALDRIGAFGVVVFTSGNGVTRTIERLLSRGRDLRALGNARLVSIGSATTAALAGYRLVPDLQAKEFVAEDLFRLLKESYDLKGMEILLPRSALARPFLREALEGEGARVTECAAYDTVKADLPPGERDALLSDPPDWLTFTSSSTVDNLFALVPQMLPLVRERGIRIASIGPITTAALERHGLKPDAQATVYTVDGLVRAVLEKETAGK